MYAKVKAPSFHPVGGVHKFSQGMPPVYFLQSAVVHRLQAQLHIDVCALCFPDFLQGIQMPPGYTIRAGGNADAHHIFSPGLQQILPELLHRQISVGIRLKIADKFPGPKPAAIVVLIPGKLFLHSQYRGQGIKARTLLITENAATLPFCPVPVGTGPREIDRKLIHRLPVFIFKMLGIYPISCTWNSRHLQLLCSMFFFQYTTKADKITPIPGISRQAVSMDKRCLGVVCLAGRYLGR